MHAITGACMNQATVMTTVQQCRQWSGMIDQTSASLLSVDGTVERRVVVVAKRETVQIVPIAVELVLALIQLLRTFSFLHCDLVCIGLFIVKVQLECIERKFSSQINNESSAQLWFNRSYRLLLFSIFHTHTHILISIPWPVLKNCRALHSSRPMAHIDSLIVGTLCRDRCILVDFAF
jgi:hypothetical protein